MVKLNILTTILASALILTSCTPVERKPEQRINAKESAPEFVVTITPNGSYELCGHSKTELEIREYLPVAAMRLPQPTLRAFVEGGIDTEAGSKALHELLINASNFGISHIVIDRPDPHSSTIPPGC